MASVWLVLHKILLQLCLETPKRKSGEYLEGKKKLILKIIWLPSQAFQFAQVEWVGFGLCVFLPLIPREGSNTVLQFCFGLDF